MPMLTMGTRKPAQPLMNAPQRKPMQNAGNQITALGGGVKPSPYAPSTMGTVGMNNFSGPPMGTSPVGRFDPRNKGGLMEKPPMPRENYEGGMIPIGGTAPPLQDTPPMMEGPMIDNMQSSLGGPSADMMSQLLRRLMAGRG